MNIAKSIAVAGLALLFAGLPSACQAVDFVLVPNASGLKWQLASNRVYFRNLNDFDGTFQGCCYSYWIDLTTDQGKAQWSVILTRMTTGGRLYFGVESKSVAGLVTYVGDW